MKATPVWCYCDACQIKQAELLGFTEAKCIEVEHC